MKSILNVTLIIFMLFVSIGFAQQKAPYGMTKIEGLQEPVEVEVNAVVTYVLEDKVLIISRNGMDKYEVITSAKFQKEFEYFFILEVVYNPETDIQIAKLKGYEVSILQAYKNIKHVKQMVEKQNQLKSK